MRILNSLAVFLLMALGTSVTAAPDSPPVFDLHSDVLYRMSNVSFDLVSAPEYISVSIPNMEKGNVGTQVFALWVDSQDHPGMEGARGVFEMIDLFHQQTEKHGDRIALATSMEEADQIRAAGKTPIFLIIEGAGPIANDLTMIRTFDRLGVRGMTLTWMHNLDWAGSSTDEENPNMGLTDFGRDVVREMNRLDWIVDLSHVSDQTFYDALEVTRDPVIVSHSGCRAIYDHPRNIDDDMLRALARNGGVLGIVAYPGYLDPEWEAAWEKAEKKVQPQIDAALEKYNGDRRNPYYRHERRLLIQGAFGADERPSIDHYVKHIMHAIEVAGPEHVAVGSDFDGIWANMDELRNAADWPNVAGALRDKGLDEATISAVMGGNAERVFRAVME